MTDRELMQMALDALEHLQTDVEWQYKSPTRAMLRKVEKALRARLAQPEPWAADDTAYRPGGLPQPEPEPVAWVYPRFWDDLKRVNCGTAYRNPTVDREPLYTIPPQREWQGLTDEEIGMLTVFDGLHHVEVPLLASFARAIEAKLKEKNT